jgi:ankyrin repeat protein
MHYPHSLGNTGKHFRVAPMICIAVQHRVDYSPSLCVSACVNLYPDIACPDYSGRLSFSARQGSTDVIEHILSHDECDVDPVNRIDGDTPLHLALQISDSDVRRQVVESLVDAGADAS